MDEHVGKHLLAVCEDVQGAAWYIFLRPHFEETQDQIQLVCQAAIKQKSIGKYTFKQRRKEQGKEATQI